MWIYNFGNRMHFTRQMYLILIPKRSRILTFSISDFGHLFLITDSICK